MKHPTKTLSNILTIAIAILITTGGVFLKFGKAKIELSSVDVFAIALTLIFATQYVILKRPLSELGNIGKIFNFLSTKLSSESNYPNRKILFYSIPFFSFLGLIHVLRHFSLHNHGADVSMVHQALFYPWGNPPLLADFSRMDTALSEHLLFSFFLIAPITSFFKSDIVIYIIQTALLSLPVLLFLRKGPTEKYPVAQWVLLAILISFKAYRGAFYWDFREDAIAFAALFGMIVSAYQGRVIFYFISLLIAIASKENIFAITFLMAIPIAFSQELAWGKNKRSIIAALTVIVSLTYGLMAFKYLIPLFTNADHGHALFIRYGKFGASSSEILFNVATQPKVWIELIGMILNKSGIRYLVILILPLLPFVRSKEALLWTVPALLGIFMNVGHPYDIQRMMIFHYELIIFPFILAAIGFSLKGNFKENKLQSAAVWSLLFALCFSGRWPLLQFRENFPNRSEWEASQFLNQWNPSERVLVDERLSAQINHLPKIRIKGPTQFNDVQDILNKNKDIKWIVFDQSVVEEKAALEKLKNQGEVIFDGNYKRIAVMKLHDEMPLTPDPVHHE